MHLLSRVFLRSQWTLAGLVILPEFSQTHFCKPRWRPYQPQHPKHQSSRFFGAKRYLQPSKAQISHPQKKDVLPTAQTKHPTGEARAQAFAQYSRGETTEALTTLSKSLPLQKVLIGSLLNAVACCINLRDFRRAADYALAAAVVDPGNHIAWYRAISAMKLDGLEREAVGLLKVAPRNVQEKAHRFFTIKQLESPDFANDPFITFQTRAPDAPESPKG